MKMLYMLCLASVIFCEAAFAEGYVKALKESVYWPNGNLREYRVYDPDGRLRVKSFHRGDGTLEKIEKYDSRGKRVEESLYDGGDKLKAGIDGWAAMKWRYDDDGRLVYETSYDEHGKALERRVYGESGKIIARMLMDDGKTDPYERLRAEPVVGQHVVTFYKADGGVECQAVVGE